MVLPHHPGRLALYALAIVALTTALVAAWVGLGQRVASWARLSSGGRPQQPALDVLVGFGIVGSWGLGLALAGLFRPPVLLLLPVAGLARGGPWLYRSGRTMRIRAQRPSPAGWCGLVIMAFLAALMLVPDYHVDATTYHLALPYQFLAVGKFTSEGASIATQCPLLVEMNYAFAVMGDLQAAIHFMQAVVLGAGLVVLGASAARTFGPDRRVIGAVAGAALVPVWELLLISKNDLAVAGLMVAGVPLVLEGAGGAVPRLCRAGCVLLGFAAAAKHSGLVVLSCAGAFLLLGAAGTRTRPAVSAVAGALGAAAIPVLPWWIKTWLWYADPLWPLLSHRIAGALWSPEAQRAVDTMRELEPGAERLQALPRHMGDALWHAHPALVPLVLAAVLGGGSWNIRKGSWIALPLAAAFVLVAAMPSIGGRYALPLFAVLAASAAAHLASRASAWTTPLRRTASAGILLAVAFPLGSFLVNVADLPGRAAFLEGGADRAAFRAERLTTLAEAGEALRPLGTRVRVIPVGEIRTYSLPGRFVQEPCYGMTWAWTAARTSETPERIRVRMRQAGARYLLYNFVTDTYPHPAASAFWWDDRMLALWRDFVSRDLDIAVPPREVDQVNGGYCLYRLRRQPRPVRQAWIPYLPGISALYYDALHWADSRDWPRLTQATRTLHARIPDVDFISDLQATGPFKMADWQGAYRAFLPSIRHHTLGDNNFWIAAVALVLLHRRDEAIPLLERTLAAFPAQRGVASTLLAKLRQRNRRAGS